eukprot:1600907-Prorocentrum_lima.AAC.1
MDQRSCTRRCQGHFKSQIGLVGEPWFKSPEQDGPYTVATSSACAFLPDNMPPPPTPMCQDFQMPCYGGTIN